MEIIKIRLTDLEQNKGQVAGLPSNPRQWTRGDLDKLIKSIEETPELLEARGLIVWPYGGKYIILGGNMRFSALREMNAVDAPCYVLPEDTPMEKLREIVIKDNGAFGAWDFDMLANEWDDLPLSEWGLPAWAVPQAEIDPDSFFEEVDKINADKLAPQSIKIEVHIPEEEADIEKEVREAVRAALSGYPNVSVR